MQNIAVKASGAALLALLATLAVLGRQQAGGPGHFDFELDTGTPATLYLGYAEGGSFSPPAPPREERPPAVLLMHGFASDRANMSPLARSLSRAGYAVLAIDVAGHGQNRNGRYAAARGQRSPFYDELEAAVLYLRTSPHVDGERIFVMGHSMGASSTLAYATFDPSLDGVVAIAGGGSLPGPHRPANALFLYAERDPQRVKTRARETAGRLAGNASLAPGELAGDFALGTAVRFEEVPDVDHVTIVASSQATARIAEWLDSILERERPKPVVLDDPRLATAGVGALLLVLALPGGGLLLGRLARSESGVRDSRTRAANGVLPLGVLAAALAVCVPLVAAGSPLPALSLELGDLAIPYLGAGGVVALCGLAALGRFDLQETLRGSARSMAAALLGVLAVMFLLAPLGAVFHRVTLTPERVLIAVVSTALLLPLWIAIEAGVRTEISWLGTALSLAARLLAAGALAAGTALGVLPSVVFLMLPILALLLLVLELPAAAIRSAGGSALLAALFQAATFGWILAAVLPVRI